MKDIYATVLSATCSSFVVYPLAVIKSQLQITKSTAVHGDATCLSPNQSNIRSVTRNIWKDGYVSGFRNTFRGVGSFLTTYPVFWSVHFYVSNNYRYQGFENKYLNTSVTSLYSSAAGSIVANPFFVINTRLQNYMIMSNRANIGTWATFLQIWKGEGFRAFFKGTGATLINNSKLVVQMPFCDYLTDELGNNTNMPKDSRVFISALTSKSVLSILMYPFDFLRTIQRNSKQKLKLKQISIDIYRTGGVRGFYNGFVPYIMMAVPNFALMMLLNEKFKIL